MSKAIETGMQSCGSEEAAARRQARIDQGLDVIVGVNKYQIKEDVSLDILEVAASVRDEQIARLKAIRAQRDNAAVKKDLEALAQVPKAGQTCSSSPSRPSATGDGGRGLRRPGEDLRPLRGDHPLRVRDLFGRIRGQRDQSTPSVRAPISSRTVKGAGRGFW